ncbi:ABC transporter permease (plasmid) [Ensifer adhaerens]|uniref:ABC transporter permease n=1 Tax=Ensifer adhaerens TaxID=106592 RepID=UPI0023A93B8B|nr:ABC transporter permease [Ensifer adhaerens]WDZ80935.1 ABC transporter permease [Ensifer adhaerens]
MISQTLRAKWTVIYALMLRDMRTRFGRSYLGYLIAIAWPLVHLSGIVVVMTYVNKLMPLGGDPAVFIATGVVPYVLCLYPSRMMGYSIDSNKPLFLFPAVKALDLMISRAIVEFLTAFVVVFLFGFCAFLAGVDLTPLDVETGATAILATVYFAISVGILNTIISSVVKFWSILFIVVMLALYLTAGIFVLPSTFPASVQNIMWFNPIFQCVEWLRSAYYEGYGDELLSKGYLVSLATVCLFLGLLGERFIRGKLLAS